MNCYPGCTREEIARGIERSLTSVCGRVRELLDYEELEIVGRRKKANGRIEQLLGIHGYRKLKGHSGTPPEG